MTRPRSPLRAARRTLAAVAATVLLAAGCASTDEAAGSGDGDAAGSADGAFPVSIEHKYGTTEIPEEPKRVLSLGYQEHDFIYALGVEPIAVRYWTGPEDDVIYPWAEEAAGDSDPPILNMVDLDFEKIAEQQPDLILGMYSGISEEEYRTLSKIAPTVTQTDEYIDYGVPWQVTTRTLGKALGREDRAEEIVTDLEGRFDAVRQDHPEWAEQQLTVVAGSSQQEGGLGFFATEDPRTRFFTELGFTTSPELDEIAGDQFYGNLSAENVDQVTADVVVWDQLQYVEGGRATVEKEPLVARLEQVRDGRVAWLEGETENAFGWQSPLSIPYALDRIVPLLEQATQAQSG